MYIVNERYYNKQVTDLTHDYWHRRDSGSGKYEEKSVYVIDYAREVIG